VTLSDARQNCIYFGLQLQLSFARPRFRLACVPLASWLCRDLRALAPRQMGVMLRDTELDQDYNRPFLLNRAWYLDDNGQAWNGATFVARGEPWYDRYCVVTCRLDMDARTLGFYVRKLPATGWKEQLEQGEDPGPLVCLVRNLPEGKELFPFVQDRHAGSGFELSRFRSYLVLPGTPNPQAMCVASCLGGASAACSPLFFRTSLRPTRKPRSSSPRSARRR
jgi:hypothetical protein